MLIYKYKIEMVSVNEYLYNRRTLCILLDHPLTILIFPSSYVESGGSCGPADFLAFSQKSGGPADFLGECMKVRMKHFHHDIMYSKK